MNVGAVAIGRNEGQRLERCLASLLPQVGRVVYVDSGSTDGSVAMARGMGAEVVELDRDTPFTAARARNAGAGALLAGKAPDLIQFVDGDCAVEPGWIDAARAAMEADPSLGIVTGWRNEIDRDASVYNQLAHEEWQRPPGPIRTCGGDMMVRREAFEETGGFDPTVIAAEDDEFCLRVGAADWQLVRLPLPMTRHDMAMTRFSEWWRRSERNGHGFAQVGAMHPPHLARERARVWFYAALLPALAVIGLIFAPWLLALVGLVYLFSYLRTVRGLMARQPMGEALVHGALLTLSKFPNLSGMIRYHRRRAARAPMRIIEYK